MLFVACACLGRVEAGPTQLDDLPAVGSPAAAQSIDGLSRAMQSGASASASAGGPEDSDAATAGRRSTFAVDPADGRVLPIALREGAESPLRAGRSVELPVTSRPDREDGTIKEMARATLDWMHERLPWSGGKDAGQAPAAAPMPVDTLVLPVETAGAASSVFAPHVARPAAAPGAQTVDPRNVSIVVATEPMHGGHRSLGAGPEDAFSRFLRFGHELIAHPLTWLAIVLVAAVQVLVSRNSRRRK